MTTMVKITIEQHNSHIKTDGNEIAIFGDGSIDHMMDAFKCALISAGFACETAAKLQLVEADE